jgi:indolepyruvate ferredoxin oxidoreductase beta subunit
MKCDIILSGVGGQGVLSMAAIIGQAATAEGLFAKQSEVHGMAQRGGAVSAHLRLSSDPISSDLIPRGSADLILSMEPVESLRYVEYLSPTGSVVTSVNAFVNIPDYPEVDDVLARIRTSFPKALLIDADRVAYDAGDVMAGNTALVGAASKLLPMKLDTIEEAVRRTFARKGERAVEVNLEALRAGRRASE